MVRTPFRWLLPAALAVAVSAVLAQETKPPRPVAPPDPQDATAAVPAVRYRSSLGDYRRLGEDDKRVPWREANDTVGRIGGWRAYAREASEPAAREGTDPAARAAGVPAAAASTPSSPPRAGHGGHGTH